jgi:hypothetical protein
LWSFRCDEVMMRLDIFTDRLNANTGPEMSLIQKIRQARQILMPQASILTLVRLSYNLKTSTISSIQALLKDALVPILN